MSQPKVGNLIKIVRPTWKWMKKGDMGVIVQVKELKACALDGDERYMYRIKFAAGPTRLANPHEFEVVND